MFDEGFAVHRIAAQRDDVAHARLPIGLGDLGDLGAARIDAGEVRGRHQLGLAHQPRDRVVGAVPRRPAGAVGDRDEARRERRQRLDRLPERFFHLLRLGREEFEADSDIAGGVGEERAVDPRPRGAERAHATTFSRA